ncbi:MAG: GntR family transcriptional regulator [Silanimonas sp.]
MDASQWVVETGSAVPIYRQIAEQVQRFVAAGQLQVGERLPSVRAMAARFGINPMTVSRAYAQLAGDGVLLRRRGAGMVVAARTGKAGLTAEARLRLLEAKLHEVIREANDLGLAAGPVCERLHALFLTPATEGAKRGVRPRRVASLKV